jgi:hypothetical protein
MFYVKKARSLDGTGSGNIIPEPTPSEKVSDPQNGFLMFMVRVF